VELGVEVVILGAEGSDIVCDGGGFAAQGLGGESWHRRGGFMGD
jgi:hypothetical protein